MTPRTRLLVDLAPVLAAVVLAAEVIVGFARRMRFPFDLEWMEGGMLAHAWRLREGLPLYPEPGPDWVPYIYPPGYVALIAAMPVAIDYPVGRAISVAGTAAAGLSLWFIGARRGAGTAGFVAAACFLGCWRASGAFYDLVRPDGLAMGILAVCLAVALERRLSTPVVAGLLLALGFTVKHHLAFFGVPLAIWLLARDGWRVAFAFGLSAALPAGLFTLVMQWATEGRFLTYLVRVPASHPIDWKRVLPGTPGEIGMWLLPAMIVGVGWLFMRTSARRPLAMRWGPPIAVGLAFGAVAVWVPEVRGVGLPPFPILVASCAVVGFGLGTAVAGLPGVGGPVLFGGTSLVVAMWMRGHYGGFLNVLMPAHFAVCGGLVLAVVALRRRDASVEMHLGTAFMMLVQVVVIERQLDVASVLPTSQDRAAGEEVVERLQDCAPGPVLSPYAAWLPVQAGLSPSPHLIAVWDLDHPSGPWPDKQQAFMAAAAAQHWTCVVTGTGKALGLGVDKHYRLDTPFRYPQGVMMPKTGWRVRPAAVWVPKISGGERPGPPLEGNP